MPRPEPREVSQTAALRVVKKPRPTGHRGKTSAEKGQAACAQNASTAAGTWDHNIDFSSRHYQLHTKPVYSRASSQLRIMAGQDRVCGPHGHPTLGDCQKATPPSSRKPPDPQAGNRLLKSKSVVTRKQLGVGGNTVGQALGDASWATNKLSSIVCTCASPAPSMEIEPGGVSHGAPCSFSTQHCIQWPERRRAWSSAAARKAGQTKKRQAGTLGKARFIGLHFSASGTAPLFFYVGYVQAWL